MAPPTAARNVAFDLLRIISIAGVVSIHTFGGIVSNPAAAGSTSWWFAKVCSAGFVWAVPVFVMLSGALNLDPAAHTRGTKEFYRRRMKRLVPALLVWTLIYLVIIRWWVLGQEFSAGGLFVMLTDSTVYPHLYFLWLILGLMLAAPVLRAFLDAGGTARAVIFASAVLLFTMLVFIVSGVMAIAGTPRPIHLGSLTMWLPYVGYFLMGWALSRVRRPSIAQIICLSTAGVALIVVTVLQVTQLASVSVLNAVLPPGYLGIGTAGLAICIFLAVTGAIRADAFGTRFRRAVAVAADAAFGVYLLHMLVLLAVHRAWPIYGANSSWPAAAAAYVVIIIVSFALSILLRRVPYVRAVL